MSSFRKVKDSVLDKAGGPWRPLQRIENLSGGLGPLQNAAQADQPPERWIYAEGDSWFNKFTPIGLSGTNLLQAIRTPFRTAVCDVSHIGDEAAEMVEDPQAGKTRMLFKLWSFDAILLSAGGNDLKNAFTTLMKARLAAGPEGLLGDKPPMSRFADRATIAAFFDKVVAKIAMFVALRNDADNARTRAAPIFLHGYDYFQPRPAAALLFAVTKLGRGPWLQPIFERAGFSDAEMLQVAREAIDELNDRLQKVIAPLGNVHVLDQRGLLTLATPGSTGDDADWLDEIHPNAGGFTKLARARWNVPLATALGWTFADGELEPA